MGCRILRVGIFEIEGSVPFSRDSSPPVRRHFMPERGPGARLHRRPPDAQPSLDLFWGAILIVLQPYPDRISRGVEHSRREAAVVFSPSPHDIVTVPEKSELTPVIEIIT